MADVAPRGGAGAGRGAAAADRRAAQARPLDDGHLRPHRAVGRVQPVIRGTFVLAEANGFTVVIALLGIVFRGAGLTSFAGGAEMISGICFGGGSAFAGLVGPLPVGSGADDGAEALLAGLLAFGVSVAHTRPIVSYVDWKGSVRFVVDGADEPVMALG